jgi:hypothetical protein
LPFVKNKSLPLHFVNKQKYITKPAASNYATFYGVEVQFYDYYEQKKSCRNWQDSTVQKNKTNKSCKPNQNKPHHTCCCGDAIAALQLFVYKTNKNKSKSLFTNQLLSILSSKHRLHKSFIVGIQRNQNFRPIVAPKPAKKKSLKQKTHMIFLQRN